MYGLTANLDIDECSLPSSLIDNCYIDCFACVVGGDGVSVGVKPHERVHEDPEDCGTGLTLRHHRWRGVGDVEVLDDAGEEDSVTVEEIRKLKNLLLQNLLVWLTRLTFAHRMC